MSARCSKIRERGGIGGISCSTRSKRPQVNFIWLRTSRRPARRQRRGGLLLEIGNFWRSVRAIAPAPPGQAVHVQAQRLGRCFFQSSPAQSPQSVQENSPRRFDVELFIVHPILDPLELPPFAFAYFIVLRPHLKSPMPPLPARCARAARASGCNFRLPHFGRIGLPAIKQVCLRLTPKSTLG